MSKNCYKISYKGDVSNMSFNTSWVNLEGGIDLDTDDQFTDRA
jgi:hypothetical protein